MLTRVIARMGLLALMSVSAASGFAQHVVIDSLFETVPGRGRAVAKSLVRNTTASQKLDRNFEKATLRTFPLAGGGNTGFELTPVQVFKPGMAMTLVGANGSTSSATLPDVKAWRGQEQSGGQRTLFLAERSDGSLGAVVSGGGDAADTVVLPEDGTAEYSVRAAEMPARDYCSEAGLVVGDTASSSGLVTGEAPMTGTSSAATGALQAEIMLDISYATYQKLGSNTDRVADYVAQLMGAVGTVYRRDLNVELVVSHLFVWTTPDLFSSNVGSNGVLDTGDQLNAYRNFIIANRSGVSRDLAHLINYNRSLGGIAYVNALGNANYGVGVSNVYAELTFPTDTAAYYWDTMVVAHEIGHNFGSPHTHCYSPPIDCCATQPDCSSCATASPAIGTIMSYCHLQARNGGGIVMNFHQRCIELITERIKSSTCLMPFIDAPHLGVAGDTLKQIYAGDMTPDITDGTDFSAVRSGAGAAQKMYGFGNLGSHELALTGPITVSGSPQFTIAQQSPVQKLAPGETSFFFVAFDPSAPGEHTATVTINTNDPAVPQFSFAIKAEVAQAAEPRVYLYRGSTNIPDGNANGITINLPVSGVSGGIMDIDISLDGPDCSDPAGVGVRHAFVGDLKMVLQSPSGTLVTLMERPGGGTFGAGGRNFCGTIFDDECGGPSIQSITASGSGQLAPPYTGRFTPAQRLSTFYGEPANGTWKLIASDLQSPDPGVLQGFSLTITGAEQSLQSGVGDWSAY